MKVRKRIQKTTLELDDQVQVDIQGDYAVAGDDDNDDGVVALRVGDTRIQIRRNVNANAPPVGTVNVMETEGRSLDLENDNWEDLLDPEPAQDRRPQMVLSQNPSAQSLLDAPGTSMRTTESGTLQQQPRKPRARRIKQSSHGSASAFFRQRRQSEDEHDLKVEDLAKAQSERLAKICPMIEDNTIDSADVTKDGHTSVTSVPTQNENKNPTRTRYRRTKQSSHGSAASAPGFFSSHRRKQSEDEHNLGLIAMQASSQRVRPSLMTIVSQKPGAGGMDEESDDQGPTVELNKVVACRHRLDRLCFEPDVSLEDLMETLDEYCEAIAENLGDEEDELGTPNIYGKLPLHIIGENKARMATRQGRELMSEFAHAFMERCPNSIVTQDNDGYVPFAKVAAEWVKEAYRNDGKCKMSCTAGDDVDARTCKQRWTQRLANSPKWSRRNIAEEQSSIDSTSSESIQMKKSKNMTMPRSVTIDVDVEWAIEMISLGFDHIAGKFLPNGKRRTRRIRREAGRQLASRVAAKVPNLMPMLLLIEYDEIRERLLSLSIVRRLLLEPGTLQCHCVGGACAREQKCRCKSWLIHMMRQQGTPSRRAVDLLQDVSNATVSDFLGTYLVPRAEDFKAFRESQQEMFQVVEDLEDIIPSLLALDGPAAQEASSTKVVFTIINDALRRPFVVGVIAKDFVLDIVLLIAFRDAVTLPPIDGSAASDAQEAFADDQRFIILIICAYYILEMTTEALSLFSISTRVYVSHLTNVWNVLDMIGIGLLLGTVHMTQPEDVFEYPVLKAVTLGVCWIRLLNVLRAVNLELATFILSIIQIILDIRWFLVVMVLSIFAFGDMIHLVTRTIDEGAICQRDDLDLAATDFCTPNFVDSYLRLYIVFVGDFVLTHYKDHSAIAAIFIIFTLLGFVVLGNVLIAVVGDSYEKTRTTSHGKFGQARLDFAVAHLSLERMVLPALPMYAAMGDESFAIPGLIFGWFVLISMLVTAAFAAGFLLMFVTGRYDSSGLMDVVAIVGAFILVVCIFVIVQSLLEGFLSGRSQFWDRILTPGRCLSAACVRTMTKYVFGMRSKDDGGADDDENGDEWTSRAEYLVNSIQFIISQAETRLDERMALTTEQALRAAQQEIVDELKKELSKIKQE